MKTEINNKFYFCWMLYFVFFSSLFLNSFTQFAIVQSQPVQQEWVQTHQGVGGGNDFPAGVVADKFGNIYITGGLFMDPQNNNYCTIKYNTSGTQQWVAVYNGPGSNSVDIATAIAVDKQGNVYVTGNSEQTGFLTDAYATIKYNSSGVQQWVSRYKYLPNGQDDPVAIAVDSLGNVYVTGYSEENSYGNFKWCTIKYNGSNGDSIWVRRFNLNPRINQYDPQEAYSMAIDRFSNIYITGQCHTVTTIKYDSSGNFIWVDTFSSGGIGRKVVTDDTGNCYVSGIAAPNNFFTIKYNTTGVQQWATSYLTYTSSADGARDIKVANNGDVFVTGTVDTSSGNNRYYCTIKYNNAGIQQWARFYCGQTQGTSTHAYALAVDEYENVYTTGITVDSNNMYNFGTVKYNANGVQQWVTNHLGGGNAITIDSNNSVIVFGSSATNIYCTIKYDQLVGIQNHAQNVNNSLKIMSISPNPVSSSAKFKINIPGLTSLKIQIINVLGQIINLKNFNNLNEGVFEYDFNSQKYPSGIYFVRIISDKGFVDCKKLLILK